jgi:hypothetical protein
MKFFERKLRGTDAQKQRGGKIAESHGLPTPTGLLPPGTHSCERMFTVTRRPGYKTVHDSVDTYAHMFRAKTRIEERCKALGLIPVFKDDYITLNSFPHRNVVKEAIISVRSCHGVKTIEKKAYFDVMYYLAPEC